MIIHPGVDHAFFNDTGPRCTIRRRRSARFDQTVAVLAQQRQLSDCRGCASSSTTSSSGSRLGRHVDGLVDAYYGPPELTDEDRGNSRCGRPTRWRRRPRDLIAELDGGGGEAELDANRRRWLRAQLVGLHTTADKLGGEAIALRRRGRAVLRRAARRSSTSRVRGRPPPLDEVLPGVGSLGERYIAWREAQAVPVEKLEPRFIRWPRTSASAPNDCSGCPTASRSSGSSRPTSRGRASTTTSAVFAAGSPSTPTCPC